MNVTETPNETRDILGNRLVVGAVFWLPALALVVAGFFNMGQGWRAALWTVALATMGVACVVNVLRCGRVHCHATGPFLLLMALVSLLYGVGVVPLGEHGWNVIGLAVLVGAVALCWLPEVFFGRYRRARVGGEHER
jgi:hypothetical protein